MIDLENAFQALCEDIEDFAEEGSLVNVDLQKVTTNVVAEFEIDWDDILNYTESEEDQHFERRKLAFNLAVKYGIAEQG